MTARLRVIQGSRGVPTTVLVRQSALDDLVDEVTALQAEASELALLALPLARQLALVAAALGPQAGSIGRDLVELLERQARRHDPSWAA
jgi:hypothetical protein